MAWNGHTVRNFTVLRRKGKDKRKGSAKHTISVIFANTTAFEHTFSGKCPHYKYFRQTLFFCVSAIPSTNQDTSSTSTDMANTSLMPTQDAKIDADPAGDLVLVIGSGEDQRSIRASSKVLSLASPVFAAMFLPGRFSEGIALSSSSPPKISLPDNDPKAVLLFCHLVHFREYHGKQPALSFDELVNMALFCDKYDAGMALNPWSELWLQPHSGIEISGGYRSVVALAYAFENQEGFWTSSRNMMQYDKADRSEDTRDELLPLIPKDLYGKPDIFADFFSKLIVLLFVKHPSTKVATLLYLTFLPRSTTSWLVSFKTVLEVLRQTPTLLRQAISSKSYTDLTFGQFQLVLIRPTWTISKQQSPVSVSRKTPLSKRRSIQQYQVRSTRKMVCVSHAYEKGKSACTKATAKPVFDTFVLASYYLKIAFLVVARCRLAFLDKQKGFDLYGGLRELPVYIV